MKMHFLLGLALIGCGSTSESAPPVAVASVVEVLQGNDQTDTVGQQLPTPILVQVVDTTPAGTASFAPPAPVPGQLVNFVVVSGGGHVFAGAALTDSLGRAQELWTLGTGAGPQTLEARAVDPESGAPIVYATITATAVPGAPVSVDLDNNTKHLVLGAPWLWRSAVLGAADQYDNPVSVSGAVAQPGALVGGDTLRALAEADGYLVVQLGAAKDSIPWQARIDLGGQWTVGFRCSAPLVAHEDSAGHTVDSVSFAGVLTVTGPNLGAWSTSGALASTLFWDGGTTAGSNAPNYTLVQQIGVVQYNDGSGPQAMAADSLGYSGGNPCGATWGAHSPLTFRR